MARTIFQLLNRKACTVRGLRSFLKSQPNVRCIINQESEFGFPLLQAVRLRKSLDIIEELLINGADVNKNYFGVLPLTAVWYYDPVEDRETHCYNIIRLLLKYGANVNEGEFRTNIPFINCVTNINVSRSEIFIPTIQMMLQHADKSTKTSALYSLIEEVILPTVYVRKEGTLKNYIEAVKLLLNPGVYPYPGLIINYFSDSLKDHGHGIYSNQDARYVISLLKIVLPYYFMQNFSEDSLNKMYHHFDGKINYLENSSGRLHRCASNISTVSPDSFTDLWNKCVEECRKMRSDMTTGNSILEILLVTCGIQSEKANATSEDVFELLIRFTRNEYPHFKDIMSHAIKNSDMRKLYILTFRELSGKVSLLDPNIFYYIAKYLEKDDLFNFLLSFNTQI